MLAEQMSMEEVNQQSPPLMTLENVRAESIGLKKLQGSALLKRLLEVRLPVTLLPIVHYADINNEDLFEHCSFTLIAVPKKQTDKALCFDGCFRALCFKKRDRSITEERSLNLESNKEIADDSKMDVNVPNNVDDENIASQYDFLFSVGNGKFLKMDDDVYLGRIGVDGGELNCQSSWYEEDGQGNPAPGFLFTLLPQSVENEAQNSFIIRSHVNGKYLGPGGRFGILSADITNIKAATKFTFDVALYMKRNGQIVSLY